MNRTKKRAHKRAQARDEGAIRYRLPYPLTIEFRIKNVKYVRDTLKCDLREAMAIVGYAIVHNEPKFDIVE